jgi:uncharacterized membrane protein YcjF (UPF0283 family)
MDLCRPIPFRADEVPSIGSLVGNVALRRAEPAPHDDARPVD